jgi:hypothetical protein
MSDSFEHNPGDHEDPLPGPTWIVSLLGAVLLIVIGMGLTALYYNAQHQEDQQKFVTRDPQELIDVRSEQLARLHTDPHYEKSTNVDGKEVTALIIPIDQAMQKVVQENSTNGGNK